MEVRILEVTKLEYFTSLLCSPLKHLSVIKYLLNNNPEDICAINEGIKAMELQERLPCCLEFLFSNNPVFVHWLLGAQTVIYILTVCTLYTLCRPKHMEGLMARLIRRLGSSLEDLSIELPSIADLGTPYLIYLVIIRFD
jgi:hypothetical protein